MSVAHFPEKEKMFAPNVANDYKAVITTVKAWPKVKSVQPK